ncbi:ABC-2 family transporter [Natranaerovirga pectinivora]|uniref:ABC-2 family transporter n=1 Tax=Natranaerovirga pectinivora TaxID=682400 RepID=A0A4R3MMF1_9FIRM|nr:ABC transporter permease [Natranaerovirga pectinivora]TCT16129.1 ABC-2 family transporter [Natranaerovirga pectinivora]
MNSSSLFLVAFKQYFTRLTRDPFGLAIFTGLPVLLVVILGMVYTQNATEEIYHNGYNMANTYIGTGMLLMFLSMSGIYLLNYLDFDFNKNMKWRLRSLPCSTHILVFAATVACTVFMIIQGVLVVGITTFFLDAYWGNIGVTLSVVILMSIFSMFLNIILFFYVKNLRIAETFAWGIAWGMGVFGGLMFDLPNNAFFTFMREYGTPYALGHKAIMSSGFIEPSYTNVWIGLIGLFLIVVLFGLLVALLGRRKLA